MIHRLKLIKRLWLILSTEIVKNCKHDWKVHGLSVVGGFEAYQHTTGLSLRQRADLNGA